MAVALGDALLGVFGQALPPVIFPLVATVAVALLIAVEYRAPAGAGQEVEI